MGNFYDEWLGFWDAEKEERVKASKFIHEEDLEWVRTKQDYRAAILCSRENGFVTAGDVMLAEIPKGWNTGKHSHGEEAMFIIDGTGFSVIDDRRYDWDTGSCLFMPYGSVHQHFNSGDEEVRYLSTMGLALERFAGLARVVQYEEACETPIGAPKGIDEADSDIHPEYGRIILRMKDAPIVIDQASWHAEQKDEFSRTIADQMRTPGSKEHHTRLITLMREPKNSFKAREVEITHILCDAPGMHSGRHAHMEAVIYVLQGEGYTIVDGEKVDWKKGTLLQVQGPQTVHQHFNTGKVESRLLRIHYGLRSIYFQPIARRVFPYSYYELSSSDY
ncbi:cupin domain-containing protein [Chloroflexota bacterium]